jgi:hypothetical protein
MACLGYYSRRDGGQQAAWHGRPDRNCPIDVATGNQWLILYFLTNSMLVVHWGRSTAVCGPPTETVPRGRCPRNSRLIA